MDNRNMEEFSEGLNRIVIPGTILGRTQDFVAGEGAYERHGNIISSLVGKPALETVTLADGTSRKTINVLSTKPSLIDFIISTGDEVLCQVIRVLMNQVIVDIVAVGERELSSSCRGIIRREDVRATEADKLVMSEYFHVSDIVKAEVVSLGDWKQYYLGCAKDGLGVCFTKSNMKTMDR